MGAGLGWALRAGGARVVTTVDGRSARSRRLAAAAGLDVLPTLPDVVAAAGVVLVVTPPGEVLAAARALAARTGAIVPLQAPGPDGYVVDWLVEEVSTSINTTAAGGNASLMTLA